ncbi:MAG TPA: tetratricopeptide repeat protein [Chroococcales cyanobacterium]
MRARLNRFPITKKRARSAVDPLKMVAAAAASLVAASPVLVPALAPQPVYAQQRGYTQELADQIMRGKQLIDANRYAEARQLFLHVLEEVPNSADAYDGLGLTYLRQGDFKQAEHFLLKGLDIDPLNVQILNNLGSACYHQGHCSQSILYYKQALSLAQNRDWEMQVNLANALADNDEVNDALNHFAEALRLKPDYAPAYNGLARVYYDHHQFKKAVDAANNAIKLKPNYAMAYYHLGLSQSALGNIPQAKTALESSLRFETNPNYAVETRKLIQRLSDTRQTPPGPPPQIGNEQVTTLLKERHWKAAELAIRATLHQRPDDPIMYNNLGYALIHQREGGPGDSFRHAAESYRKAIELRHGKPFPEAEYNLGQAYRLMGENEQAETAFRKAIADAKQTVKSFPQAQNALGIMLKTRGDLKGASAAYRMALSQAGNDYPVIHYNLAILLEKMEKTREAVREYKLYLAQAPNGLNVKQAQTRLKRLLGSDGA